MTPSTADEARPPVSNVLGHRMELHDHARDRFIAPSLARLGVFEPFQTELVVNEVRPGDTCLDLGAHVGYYTLILARLVGPSGKVLAFEPDPDNFALLKRNVELNGYGNVELYNAAVSDRPGRSRLFQSSFNAGDHRLHDSPGEARPGVDVDVVALDELLRDRVGNVDFVKMDVQGSEGAALDGMRGLLARSPRFKMMVEFWPAGLVRASYGAERFLANLAALNLRLYEMDEAACTVRRADPRQLLERFPAAEEGFTNLLCVKAPLVPPLSTPGG